MADSLADQPAFRTRFARVITVLGQVEGPFVARLLDSDSWGEVPWVATEYVPGPDLHRMVTDSGPLDYAAWEGLAAVLLSALVRLHEGGLVHRDLKRANILLAAEGPKLIDFGVD